MSQIYQECPDPAGYAEAGDLDAKSDTSLDDNDIVVQKIV